MIQSRRMKPAVAVAVLLGGFLMTTTAEAQTLNQVLNAVDTAINRATQARDRAIEARDRAVEIKDTIQEGVVTLSTEVRGVILEAIDELSDVIDEELAGRDAFVNGPECPAFRQDLISLVQGLEDLLFELAAIADPNAPLPNSFQDEIALIGSVPCRALYPLYRALTLTGFLSQGLLDQVDAVVVALPLIQQLIANTPQSVPGKPLDYELGQVAHQLILANPATARQAVLATQGLALSLNMISGRLIAKGHTGLAGVEAQIHGYIGVSLVTDKKMQWGKNLKTVSDMLKKVAAAATSKIDHAMSVGIDEELRIYQQAILSNQTKILANQKAIMLQLGVTP